MTTQPDPTSLPEDLATCHAIIRELLANLQRAYSDKEKLQHHLAQLLRARYGPRADRLNPDQLLLFAREILERGTAPVDAVSSAMRETAPPPAATSNGHGRKRLPKDLPRKRIEYDVPPEERICPDCGGQKTRIGEDVSEQLEYVPASMLVIEHVRAKYACKHCESGVVTADKPPQPIEKGLPGPGMLAHVVTSKYCDHLPLYRMEHIFERHGVELSRSTLCDWMAVSAEVLQPLYERLCGSVRQSDVLHTDDTPLPVQDKTIEQTRTGRLWVYLGDEEHPHTIFEYTPNRSRDGPAAFLKDYRGYLQADAYGGYNGIYAGGHVIEIACWAHVRRKYVDAQTSDPGRAVAAVAWIRRLYDVEDRAKAMSADERRALRQAESKPLLNDLKKWLDTQLGAVAPKSPMHEAIAYTLSNWTALTRYPEDGRLAIDNNAAERALRGVAIGRKNWLFAGSDNGGHTAAVLLSFVETCKRHQIDPFAYLRDVLARIATLPVSRIDELLPDQWKALQTAATPTAARPS